MPLDCGGLAVGRRGRSDTGVAYYSVSVLGGFQVLGCGSEVGVERREESSFFSFFLRHAEISLMQRLQWVENYCRARDAMQRVTEPR